MSEASSNEPGSTSSSWWLKAVFGGILLAGVVGARMFEVARVGGSLSYGAVDHLLGLGVVFLLTTAAAWAGGTVGAGLKRGVWVVLLASLLGGLAATLVTPVLGVVWGFGVGVAIVMAGPRAVGIWILRGSLAGAIGFVAAVWIRNLQIDSPGQTLALVASAAAAIMMLGLTLFVPVPGRGAERPRRARVWRVTRRLLTFSLATILLAACWLSGWHFAVLRRLEALEADGIRVHLNWPPPWPYSNTTFWKTLWMVPQTDEIVLQDPDPKHLATLRAIDWGRRATIKIAGFTVDDARVRDLPDVWNAWHLMLVRTRLTGEALPPNLRPSACQVIEIVDTPLTDSGLLALAGNSVSSGTLTALSLSNTDVTGAGLARLLNLRLSPTGLVLSIADADFSDTDLKALLPAASDTLFLDCPQVSASGLEEIGKSPFLSRVGIRLHTFTADEAAAIGGIARRIQLVSLEVPEASNLAALQDVPVIQRIAVLNPIRLGDPELLRAARCDEFQINLDTESPLEETAGVVKELQVAGVMVHARVPPANDLKWKRLLQAPRPN